MSPHDVNETVEVDAFFARGRSAWSIIDTVNCFFQESGITLYSSHGDSAQLSVTKEIYLLYEKMYLLEAAMYVHQYVVLCWANISKLTVAILL